MGDSDKIKCVICAKDATPKIIKDKMFNLVLNFLWSELNVDVKFHENANFDLCERCFTDICNFYDQNDMCVIFEKRIESLKRDLVAKTIAGVHHRKSSNTPALTAYQRIETKFGRVKLEKEDTTNQDQYQYGFESHLIDPSDDATEQKTSYQDGILIDGEITVKNTKRTVIEYFGVDGTPKPSSSKDKEKDNDKEEVTNAKTPTSKSVPSTRPGRKFGSYGKNKRGRKAMDDSDDDNSSNDDEALDVDDNNDNGWPSEWVRSNATTRALEPVDQDGLARRQCSICLDKFADTGSQKIHVKNHTVKPGDQKPFQCRICREQFKESKDLIAHNAIHYDQKLFPCSLCKKIDSKNESEKRFANHMKKEHWKW